MTSYVPCLTTSCMLALVTTCFNPSTLAQISFVPVQWNQEVSSSKVCGLTNTPDFSDALATVVELIKSNDIASSLPKSCMEIKESSPVSPSGYYTISNGSGGSMIVYCNMDEPYCCPSLEQTLKGFSDTLATNSACEKISTSCQEVWDKCPECTSGYYKILAADLTEKYVYCDFEEKCGTAGPWTRVAYLNMSDTSVCPAGTQKFVSGSVIACGIQEPSNPKCVTTTYSITHSYSQICGQMVGYQKGSPDAFKIYVPPDIEDSYVQGVSITRGSPRQHVWTYAIGLQENLYYDPSNPGTNICPCGATSVQQVPSFVGSDYYCESGCPGPFDLTTIYTDDVLWDGQQCGTLETGCCTNTDQPWFHKVLDTTTSDGIEIRLCINQPTSDENILLSMYEIYVK